MSEVRLVICDAQRDIHANRHGGFARGVIAALGDDPQTIEELDIALERFIAPSEWSNFRGFQQGEANEPFDAGLVVVDLAARLVVCDSTYCTAEPEGSVAYHDGCAATGIEVPYHLPPDWRLVSDATDWRTLAEQRRRRRQADPPLEARAVLYGEPLLRFLARECFESFAKRTALAEREYADPAYQQERELIRQIHVRWMMTPRDDLRGNTPRQMMMARHSFVSWSLQDREEQWSLMERCPRGLDPETSAYCFAGFGTHEMVEYYEMVRELLWCCRDLVAERRERAGTVEPTADDFAADAAVRLAEHREWWLDEPDPECDGRTPRSIIHNERARIPEGTTGEQAMIDPDCPLCQMQAEMPGTSFWGLDGCNMDDDFAFSMWHESYEEWEAEQRELEESSRRWKAKEAERERLGVADPGGDDANTDSVWKSSFSAPESPGQPAFVRLFAIGAHLSELIANLKEPAQTPQGRDLIDLLSRAFGNLNQVFQSADAATADVLIQPVLDRFREALEVVAGASADLSPKCADLQQRLHRFGGSLGSSDEMDDGADPFDEDDPPPF